MLGQENKIILHKKYAMAIPILFNWLSEILQ
jgi:hypothetical protein